MVKGVAGGDRGALGRPWSLQLGGASVLICPLLSLCWCLVSLGGQASLLEERESTGELSPWCPGGVSRALNSGLRSLRGMKVGGGDWDPSLPPGGWDPADPGSVPGDVARVPPPCSPHLTPILLLPVSS